MIFRGTTLVRQQVAHSKSNNGRWTELSYSIQKVSSEATSASIPRHLSPSGRVSKKDGDAYYSSSKPFIVSGELLATYLLRKLKGELLGKTVLLPATIIYQARRVVPTLKELVLVCQHQQIDARVDVSIMMNTAMSTRPFTDIHRLLLAFYAARRTDLSGCEPGVCLDERPSVEV